MFSRSKHVGKSDNSPTPKVVGISSASKAIARTPAQDRLNRLRKSLANNLIKEQIKNDSSLVQSVPASGLVKRTDSLSRGGGADVKPIIKLPATVTSLASTRTSGNSENVAGASNFDRYAIRRSLGLSVNNSRPDCTKSSTTENIARSLIPPVKLCEFLRGPSDKSEDNSTTPIVPTNNKETTVLSSASTNPRKRRSGHLNCDINTKISKQSPDTLPKTMTSEHKKTEKLNQISRLLAEHPLGRSPESTRNVRVYDDDLFRVPTQSCLKDESSVTQGNDSKPTSKDIQSRLMHNRKNSETEITPRDKDKDDDVIMKPATSFSISSSFQRIKDVIKSTLEKFNIKPEFDNTEKTNNCETQESDADCLYIVTDTNLFLHNFAFLKELIEEPNEENIKVVLYLPYVMIDELDSLKQSNRGVSTLAQRAVKYINEKLKKRDKSIRVQTVFDSFRDLIPINNADDRILNCCLQLKANNVKFILLSNDINLRNKALVNNVRAYARTDVKEGNLRKFL